jgi:propionyl-CoA carboxylase alpha chain
MSRILYHPHIIIIPLHDPISKLIAKNAGCFVIPGYEGEVDDEDHAVALSQEVGYPVMIKASAGGGGKGMRVAYNDEELREGFRMSKAEALSSFGDDRMLIERFIEDPHHIEIQVVADTHGNVIAFPERECSVQRRNQKVIEESPSCLLLPETRKAMQEQAIALCKATGYRSAGTVEMLCDGKQNFYFLEMNTRLQVEHPITELVSGEDLVEHMLYVAAGKPLPKRLTDQTFIPSNGWAIESRVYAEDPFRNFLPSIGPLVTYKEPRQHNARPYITGNYSTSTDDSHQKDLYAGGDTVRIDTGVYEGGTISVYYDPMIAKLCTHGPSRDAALATMRTALDEYYIRGLGHNLNFLRDVCRNEVFKSGDYSTKFIEMEYPNGFVGVQLNDKELNQAVATACALHHARLEQKLDNEESDVSTELEAGDEVYMTLVMNKDGAEQPMSFRCVYLEIDEALQVNITRLPDDANSSDDYANIDIDPYNNVTISALDWTNEAPLARIMFEDYDESGTPYNSNEDDMEMESNIDMDYIVNPMANGDITTVQYGGATLNGGFDMQYLGCKMDVRIMSSEEFGLGRYMLPEEKIDVSKVVLCPMPGTLISCSVEPGQSVEAGQELAVIEAMKMQNVLRAEKKAVIKTVLHGAGANLKVDEVIIEFVGDDEEGEKMSA